MKVIGFCGLPGSGKSTAISAIEDFGIIITMGDVVRMEAKKRKVKQTDENLGRIAKELRKKGGREIIAEKSIELIKAQTTEVVFIDGIRSLSEVMVFRRFWKFPLVAIITTDTLRYKRISERDRSDDSKNLTEIMERDRREINFGLKEVISKADYTIENNSTIDELKKTTRERVLEIIKKY